MERKTYAEKLKDPRWQRRRLEILSAADFKCRDCGSGEKTLHVHHVRYLPGREPWEYPDELLRSVCEDCHRIHTELDGVLRASLELLSDAVFRLGFSAKGDVADAVEVLASLLVDDAAAYGIGAIAYLVRVRSLSVGERASVAQAVRFLARETGEEWVRRPWLDDLERDDQDAPGAE